MLNGTEVSAIVFYVRDLERASRFYGETLGLVVRRGVGHEGGYMVAEAGRTLLVFFEGEHTPGRTPIVVFGLERGIENVVQELARKGVEIVLPVSEAPGGLTADFLDPDGHVLSLYQTVADVGAETSVESSVEPTTGRDA